MRPGRGNVADVATIVQLHGEGVPNTVIAQRLGVAQRTVQRHLKAQGLTRWTPNPVTDVDKARAEALLNEGASLQATADVLGFSATTISYHFPGRGWTPTQIGAHGLATMKTNRRLRNLGYTPLNSDR